MNFLVKSCLYFAICSLLSGCLVTSIVGGAVSAVGTAVDVVDTVTPDIID